MEEYGSQKENFSASIDKLESKDRALYDMLAADGDVLENLLASMNSLLQINDYYRQRLKECEGAK